MSELILIAGGARSGKSSFAENLCKELGSRKLYVATAPVLDDEMRFRVAKHQQQRKSDNWDTVEEELDLLGVIKSPGDYDVVLIDCLTLWLNNLLFAAEQAGGTDLSEEKISELCSEIIRSCQEASSHVVMVINEVGLGIVPENRLARLFRDLSGRCSQTIAAAADRVYFTSCGIPLRLK